MKLRILDILKEKGKTKYWLYIQLGLSYQNFNKIVNNQTSGIKFENLKAICDILECTPNDLFEEYYKQQNFDSCFSGFFPFQESKAGIPSFRKNKQFNIEKIKGQTFFIVYQKMYCTFSKAKNIVVVNKSLRQRRFQPLPLFISIKLYKHILRRY